MASPGYHIFASSATAKRFSENILTCCDGELAELIRCGEGGSRRKHAHNVSRQKLLVQDYYFILIVIVSLFMIFENYWEC